MGNSLVYQCAEEAVSGESTELTEAVCKEDTRIKQVQSQAQLTSSCGTEAVTAFRVPAHRPFYLVFRDPSWLTPARFVPAGTCQ